MRSVVYLVSLLSFLISGNLVFAASGASEIARLPLGFEPTSCDPIVFIARGNGYAIRVDAASVRLSLGSQRPGIGWMLEGAQVGALAQPLDRLPGRVNYLVGSDPREWRVNVPTYERVVVSGVYPGIDEVFYGNQRELEHDYLLASKADPHRIRLRMLGPQTFLDRGGEILVRDGEHSIRLHRPRAFQVDALGISHWVRVAYIRHHDGSFGFRLGRYDHSLPLRIDPVLTYSTYVAGSSGDLAQGIAVDSQGNAYITGMTSSTDFPISSGAEQSTCNNCTNSFDVFVSKLNAAGTALMYSTYVGGSDYDQPSAIAVDSNGNALVGGGTRSQDFPLFNNNSTWGIYPGASTGLHNHGFLFSLNPTGTAFNFSTYVAGSGDDSVASISADSNGNIFAVGATDSPNFPVTAGALTDQPAYPLNDVFVMKFVPAGTLTFSALIGPKRQTTSAWANYLYPSGISVDANANIFISGFASDGFPTTAGSYQPMFNGNPNGQTYNAFVAKLDSAGSQILAATYIGGSSQDEAKAIALDGAGNAYITGIANSTNFPVTASAYQKSIPACCASFVAKFDPTLATLEYSTFLTGTSSSTNAFAIAIDTAGQAVVTGDTSATGFPLVNPIVAEPATGQFGTSPTAFVTQFNAAGSALTFSSYYGGSTGSHGMGVALDNSGSAYIAGTTNDTDLPTTPNGFQTTVAQPPQDVTPGHAFVAKIDLASPGPSLCPSSASLNFLYVRVGTASRPTNLTISNCGSAALTVASVTSSGDFSEIDNCTSASVSPENSCTVQVTFTPTAEGQRPGSLLITSNTGVNTRVALTGYGAEPHIGSMAGPITFDNMLIGVTTPVSRNVILTNIGQATLTISSLMTTGDFAQSNTCPQTLLPGQNCLVTLTFTPTAQGLRTGAFTVTSDDPNGPASVTLNGTGYAAYPAPSINSITPNSVVAGSSSVQLSVFGSNFFPASVIQVNGVTHTTTYQSGSFLYTTLTAGDLTQMSEPQVTVTTPSPDGGSATAILTVYLSVPISAAGFTFDPYTRRLFAAVPSGALTNANSIVPIDPLTGNVGTGAQVGDDPAKTTISNDGQYLYIMLNGDHAVRRYNIASATPDIEVNMPSDPTFGQLRAMDLAVVPNDSHSFLATLQRSGVSPSEGGIALFTDNNLHTFLSNNFPTYAGPDTVRFMSDPTVAWGLENGNTLMKFSLASSGLSLAASQINGPLGGQIESDGSYLYSHFGQVYDPIHQNLIGTYTNLNVGGSVLPDSPLGRTFFYEDGDFYAYDQSTCRISESADHSHLGVCRPSSGVSIAEPEQHRRIAQTRQWLALHRSTSVGLDRCSL